MISGPVDFIAESLANARWKLYKIVDGEKEEVLEHKFIDFMKDPNPMPEWTSTNIWKSIFIHHYYVGEGYGRIEEYTLSNNKKSEHQYYFSFIPANDVIQVPMPENMYYTVRMPNDSMQEVHASEMFVLKNINPSDPYGRGVGVVKALADIIELSEETQKFQKSFFRNGAKPDGMASIEGATEEALKRFEKIYNEQHEGGENAHKMIFTSGKVTLSALDVNMKDLDMQEGTRLLRDLILEFLKIPRELMGITENSNRATSESAQYIFAENVLQKKLSSVADAINRMLIPLFENKGEELLFEYENIVPHDNAFRHQQAVDGWNNGAITLDEARELDGFDSLPDDKGKVFKSDILFKYISADENFADLEILQPDDGFGFMNNEEYLEKGRISNVDKAFIHAKNHLYKKSSAKFNSTINDFLKTEKEEILKKLDNSKSKKNGSSDFDYIARTIDPEDIVTGTKEVVKFIDGLIDWEKEAERLMPKLENLWKDVYENGKEAVTNIYRFNNTNKNYLDITKRLNGKEIMQSLFTSTKGDLQRFVRDTIKEGGNVDDLKKKISSDVNLFGKERASKIVDEQVRSTANKATHDTYVENGIQRKRWFIKDFKDARPSHRKMNGEIRDVNEKFSNGAMHPRDSSLPDEEKFGCRCEEFPLRD